MKLGFCRAKTRGPCCCASSSAALPRNSHSLHGYRQRSAPHSSAAAAAVTPARLSTKKPPTMMMGGAGNAAPPRAAAATTAAAAAPAGGPTEAPAGMEAEARLLEELVAIPQITKATVRAAAAGSGAQVTVQSAQHNLPANAKRQLVRAVHVPDTSRPGDVFAPALPVELPPMDLQSVSPSGRRMLVAKSHDDGVLLEVWVGGRLAKELQVPKALHGPVINDGWFSRGAAWSPDESKIAYVAELPAAEKTPQWCGGGASDKGNGGGGDKGSGGGAAGAAAAPRGWRGVAEAREDWGELNTGKGDPAVFVLDCGGWAVTKLAGTPQDHSCGQPAWAPDGSGLVYVAWPHAPPNFPATKRRLGIVFCYNRPCALYFSPYSPPPPPPATAAGSAATTAAAAAAPAAVPLTGELLSAFAPVFTPDGQVLVFLSQDAAARSGVHSATTALHTLPWRGASAAAAAAPKAVVPVVERPAAGPDAFPGLYAGGFPESPFLSDRVVLVNTQWRSQAVAVAVGLDDGTVAPVTPLGWQHGSWAVQGAAGGVVAAVASGPGAPPALFLAPAPPASASAAEAGAALGSPDAWARVDALAWDAASDDDSAAAALPAAAAALANVDATVLEIKPPSGDETLAFEAVVHAPKARGGKPAPVIVFPHGGPHTAIAINYYMPFAFLTSLGYAVVAVNYRGSTGFGEAALQSLPGKIGRQDADDCVAALDAAVAAGIADGGRAAVIGGSHGGFLTGHLVGQFPERWRCAGLRNPVLNIALMVGLSDIPDWCYVEVLGTEEGRARFRPDPTPEDLAAFHAASPAAHLHNVTAPLMFMLGAKDRRVPLDDGRRYAEAARAAGVETRTLVFPNDTHALDKPQTEFEQWLNLAWWLKRHALGGGEGDAGGAAAS